MIAAAVPLAAICAFCWPSGYMVSRDIGCGKTSSRGTEICRALSASMEWTWMGHAIVSPGWRPTTRGVARVWCAARITDADVPVLEALRQGARDWRLESGADDLIRLNKDPSGRSACASDIIAP